MKVRFMFLLCYRSIFKLFTDAILHAVRVKNIKNPRPMEKLNLRVDCKLIPDNIMRIRIQKAISI